MEIIFWSIWFLIGFIFSFKTLLKWRNEKGFLTFFDLFLAFCTSLCGILVIFMYLDVCEVKLFKKKSVDDSEE